MFCPDVKKAHMIINQLRIQEEAHICGATYMVNARTFNKSLSYVVLSVPPTKSWVRTCKLVTHLQLSFGFMLKVNLWKSMKNAKMLSNHKITGQNNQVMANRKLTHATLIDWMKNQIKQIRNQQLTKWRSHIFIVVSLELSLIHVFFTSSSYRKMIEFKVDRCLQWKH